MSGSERKIELTDAAHEHPPPRNGTRSPVIHKRGRAQSRSRSPSPSSLLNEILAIRTSAARGAAYSTKPKSLLEAYSQVLQVQSREAFGEALAHRKVTFSALCGAGESVDGRLSLAGRPPKWGRIIDSLRMPLGILRLEEHEYKVLSEANDELLRKYRARKVTAEDLERFGDVLNDVMRPYMAAYDSNTLELIETPESVAREKERVRWLPSEQRTKLSAAFAKARAVKELNADVVLELVEDVKGVLRQIDWLEEDASSREVILNSTVPRKKRRADAEIKDDRFLCGCIEDTATFFEEGILSVWNLYGLIFDLCFYMTDP